ncbi:MAG TPA: toll/interleukin-1 receptor domain-containing protein, partial [Anaerolineales bacterium]|nr:toll/interleukin-1 receptor domain-containing protein [Anaerolineales bacterium]
MARNIFLSYSRKDKDFAKKVAEDLEEAGHDVWWDITDIDGGDRWAKEIQEGLNQSQILVLIVSSNSVVSEWVEKEFLYASSRNMKIVPLIYEHCDLPIWLLNLQYIDISGENYDINFQQILEACEKFGRRSGDAKALPSKISARLTHISPYWLLLLISTFLAIIVTVLLTSPSVKPVAPTPTSSNTSIPTSSNTSTPIPTDTNTHT